MAPPYQKPLRIFFSIKTRCAVVMFKVCDNTTLEINFRCVLMCARDRASFLSKPTILFFLLFVEVVRHLRNGVSNVTGRRQLFAIVFFPKSLLKLNVLDVIKTPIPEDCQKDLLLSEFLSNSLISSMKKNLEKNHKIVGKTITKL